MLISVEQIDFKRHPLFTDADDMKQIIKPLSQYNVTHMTYSRRDEDEGVLVFSTDPLMEEIFIRQKFYQQFGCATYDSYSSGFYLGDFLSFEPKFVQALHSQNIWHFLIIVQRHLKSTEIFFFGAPVDMIKINHFYLNYLNLFEKFIFSFKEQLSPLISQYENQRLYYPNGNDFSELVDESFAKKFLIQEQSDGLNQLTLREKNCLHYFKQGYTAKMIAQTLNISYRTVEHHLAHTRKKLGVLTKVELLRLLNGWSFI